MKNKPPAFMFYPKDWLDKRVLRMSDEAQGIYMRLLCYMWKDSENQCSIEKDDATIEKVIGISHETWKKVRREIFWRGDPILKTEGKYYVSSRLRKEREKQVLKSEKARESAEKRWHANA